MLKRESSKPARRTSFYPFGEIIDDDDDSIHSDQRLKEENPNKRVQWRMPLKFFNGDILHYMTSVPSIEENDFLLKLNTGLICDGSCEQLEMALVRAVRVFVVTAETLMKDIGYEFDRVRGPQDIMDRYIAPMNPH